MGKLVVLLDMGISKSAQVLLLLLLMALCVGNHGSEVHKFITLQKNQEIETPESPTPPPLPQILASASVAALKQTADENGAAAGGIVNGGKPGIESYGNVTVLAGQRGELKCRTFNLANYTVLWLRHRDTHLLSAGADAYTADPRFRAFQATSTWGLRISSTRPSDGGVYECQISTTPPISAFTYLTVVEPVTHIEGLNGRGSELFIKAGSTINLTCIVEDATDNAPKHILWRHNSRAVNFEWARGGMSLVTEKKSKGVTVSRLLIQKAVRTDSGVYMCAPQNAHPAYVKIHVLEHGEKQAAMQSASSTSKRTYILPVCLLIIQFILLTNFDNLQNIFSSLLTSTFQSKPSLKITKSYQKDNISPTSTTNEIQIKEISKISSKRKFKKPCKLTCPEIEELNYITSTDFIISSSATTTISLKTNSSGASINKVFSLS